MSLHSQWIKDISLRNFDIFISYSGNNLGTFQDQSNHYEAVRGLKWPNLARLFLQKRHLLLSYEACWFPDDNLLTDTQTISKMFNLFHLYDLWLAQPALPPGSQISHPATRMIQNAKMHFTDFVEIMCPIFNRKTLTELGPTFAASVSGYGLDFLWPYLLGYPKDRLAVLDASPIKNIKPAVSESFFKLCLNVGIDPNAEWQRITRRYGLSPEPRTKIYATIPSTACV